MCLSPFCCMVWLNNKLGFSEHFVRANNVGRGLAPAASVTNILSICNVRTNQGFPLKGGSRIAGGEV